MQNAFLSLIMILIFSSCNFEKETASEWKETPPDMADKVFANFNKKDLPAKRDYQDCVQLDGETYFFEYPGTIEFVFNVTDKETVSTKEISDYIRKKCTEDPLYFENIFKDILACVQPKRDEFDKKSNGDMEKLKSISGGWIEECTKQTFKK